MNTTQTLEISESPLGLGFSLKPEDGLFQGMDQSNVTIHPDFTQNTSLGNETVPPGRDEELAKVEVAVQALIFVMAVVGNGIVLIVLFTRSKKLSRMNMMIVHLSIADLFVAFFNVLPQMIWDITYRFHGNDFLCRSVKYLQVVAMYASSYVLVTTAIDRYLAIVHPMTSQTWTSRKTHFLAAIAWGLSLLFSVPQLTIFAYRQLDSGEYDCWAHFHPEWTVPFYITWITVAIYIIPSLLLVFAYGKICHVVWKSMRAKEPSMREAKVKTISWKNRNNKKSSSAENGSLLPVAQSGNTNAVREGAGNPRAHVRGLSRAKMKTVRLTMTVIICYLVCWGPWFVGQMWGVWDPKCPFNTSKAMVIVLLLASLNSCTNPWIYLAFSDNLYRQLARCMRRRRPRNSRASTYDDSRFRSTRMTTNTDISHVEFSTTSPADAMKMIEKK